MLNAILSQRTLACFSIETEIDKLLEEMEELKTELLNFKYCGRFEFYGECKKHYDNLLLEMADVEIVLSHLWHGLGSYGVFMSATSEKTEKLREILSVEEKKYLNKGGKK